MLEKLITLNDYLLFSLGFIFLLVSLYCLYLRRFLADRPGWVCFSLFSLVQTIYFWGLFGDDISSWLPITERAFFNVTASVSFSLLLIAALNFRNSFGDFHRFKKWWYLPSLVASIFGWFGLKAFVLAQLFIVAIPAAYFVNLIFSQGFVFKVRRKNWKQRSVGVAIHLYLLSLALCFANFLQNNTRPVNFIDLLIALLFAGFLWFSVPTVNIEETSDEIEKSQSQLKAFLPLSILSLLLFGLILTEVLANSAMEGEFAQKKGLGNSFELLLESHFDQTDQLIRGLGKSPELLPALKNPSSYSQDSANAILDLYASLMHGYVAYLMDKEGNTIASSNRNASDSFVGKNFVFRPYFQKAIQGEFATYLAKGSVSKVFGYYSAAPVFNTDSEVMGVAVIKVELTNHIAEHLPNIPAIALIDENSDLVSSNRSDGFWQTILPVNHLVFKRFDSFENEPTWMQIGYSSIENDKIRHIFQGRAFLWRYDMSFSKWSFVVLDSSSPFAWAVILGISMTLFACVIALGISVVWVITLKTALESEKGARIYQTLVEGSSDIVALIDLYGNFIALNEAGKKEFAADPESLPSVRLAELWHEESAQVVREAIQKSLSGQKISCEAYRIDDDGIVSYWELSLNPVIEEQSRPSKIIGIFHNFTERKLATQELRKEKDLTENLLNTAQAIILMLDTSARVIRVNRYFYELTGFTPEEVIGEEWLKKFVAEQDRIRVSSFFQKYSPNMGVQPLLNQIVTADGRSLDIEWKNRTLRDENRKAIGIIAVGQDVTQHLVTQNTLRESKSKFAMLNNCFVRFGNSPRENIDLLGEIAWMLTGSDIVMIKELQNGQFVNLNVSSISDELAELVSCKLVFNDRIASLGKDPIFIKNLQTADGFADCQDKLASAVICAVYLEKEIVGAMFCCFEKEMEGFSEEDMNLISIVARAVGVEIARLREDQQLRNAIEELASRDKRMSLEMQIARTVHRSFLPDSAPKFPPYEIGFVFRPCFSVGGDYFEFIPFNEKNQLGILFADISGHGVAGALLSSMLKVILFAATNENNEPSAVISKMNDQIEENFPEGYFVAAFFALLDEKSDSIVFSSAAPEPALLLHKDGSIERIGRGGQPMGLLPSEFTDEETFATTTVKMNSGDTLIFFTDGLTDIKISETERIGLDRLCDWLSEQAGQTPEKLTAEIFARAEKAAIEKGIDDDIMLLAISRD